MGSLLSRTVGIICLLFATTGIVTAQNRNQVIGAAQSTRVALVIGNAAYPGVAALKNPANDANDIAAKLRRLNFDVTLKTNVGLKDMLRTLTAFGNKVQSGSEVLIFYAGHGMQVKGKNYLIPIDAEIGNETAVSSEAVDVDQLLDKLANARLSMVILDACRNNPFERRFRGYGQGLAQINAPTGTLIAYSTAPGKVASDGDGRNGLYTQELLAAIDLPGFRVEDVFKRVRVNVVKKSGETQTPWESSSLTGDFYFRSTGEIPAQPQMTDSATIEMAFWESIKGSDDPEDFQAYVDKYPNGQFIALAERRSRRKSLPSTAPGAEAMAPAQPSGSSFKDCPDCPEMVVIPAGVFQMGSTNDDTERPVHPVILKPFALGKTEITQGQWKAIMGSNPSGYKECGDNCAMDRVNWYEAREFIAKLNAITGKTYRLPSEAEWEYACLAGGMHEYCGGNNASDVAWHGSLFGGPKPVASKQANAWGLYDMSGNVQEWTEDCWNGSYYGAPNDGVPRATGDCSRHIIRGGSWDDFAGGSRARKRSAGAADFRAIYLGFRVARVYP